MTLAVSKIGVAVIELAGGDALTDAIDRLTGKIDVLAAVCRNGPSDGERTGFAWIPSDGETIPRRRHRGGTWLLNDGGAKIAVLLEDTTDLSEGWDIALSDAFADPTVGCVWGPVEIAPTLPARYRALGRLEYGRFANGNGTLPAPPGNALALRDALLDRHLAVHEGLVEADLAETLSETGQRMHHIPEFRSTYARRDPHGAKLSTRFQHGRIYASGIAANAGLTGRAALAVKSLAVPAVLALRGVKAALAGGNTGSAIAETGWIAAMSLAWGLGECAGALFGPGQSHRSWR